MRRLAAHLAGLMVLLVGAHAHAQGAPTISELYTLCAFYPQPGTCDAVYERAAKDNHPAASTALATYSNYARYLKTDARALTEEDRRYLQASQINLPDTLKPVELGGLHGVINDRALADPAVRLRTVQAFLRHAVQAHMYCVLHDCGALPTSSSAPLPPAVGS